ncbi:MAG TPA: glycosyltransferase family 2 protein [Tepidisphaeraceae bacterium]|nr:glycosyltransferase family 2 protein [Tepidisphaeraceae bacterium]
MRWIVAIPVFNEIRTVRQVLDKVREFHSDILVIDDGSTDGTAELLDSRDDIQVIHHATNRGYGQSIIDSFNYADANGYDWVITMDCDEQHDPETIPHFVRQIRNDEYDLISGSRYLRPHGDDDLPPGDRRLINSTITSMVNSVLGFFITDAFCGFKAHRVSAMMKLRLDETGYAFPMQLWPRLAATRARIKEIPVRLIYKDLNRTFGGALDNADIRLAHYLDVFNRELQWQPPLEQEPCPMSCE